MPEGPKGYVILTETIKDPAGMDAYSRAAGPSMVQGGASVLAVDGQPQVLEGAWHGDRTVVLEFASVAAARAWYESAAYERAKPLRHAAADTNAVIVSGFEPPPRHA
ncbi:MULTISPECIES: DUF1330 domain-containing protein [unclassified Streptomyces]|uniref:DUF1330 domain-containing protein n=1 Tax=unclassified Streptomyces TaxID=2593676 RepID=UPI002E81E950|nr:DUF1330 domain-containing protein [Streptomyces sp. NBC_00589]WTI35648.1 DUF1330 domain-containing protein [Streptomyces sp. NBC_00775]WUB30678.1 DUF1330 domain-containing protein [Streptomyces sp. NBC_00589]